EILGEVEELRAERNTASREIGRLKEAGEDASGLIATMKTVSSRISELDDELAGVEGVLEARLLAIPNVPDPRVPEGGEGEFEVLSSEGELPEPGFEPRPHWEIGEALGILDLERGARLAGSGFPLLVGAGARLQRGLIDFMLDLHREEHGYVELAPPYMVTRESMTGTGHLPKFETDAYRTEPDDLFLVPTAEVPVTNLHRGEILEAADLPLAYVAYTPCFRREAGSAGRDTRGLLRVHQFDKVEMVRLCRPERSSEELELLTGHAEEVLRRLGVPFRRILLPTGDLGFGNAITYDLEVWSAGVADWLEVSSCSCYTDYQARRMGIRFRPAPGQGPEFVHTLNGSGVALARLIVALLENGQQEDGSVRLPEPLHPYLGFDRIPVP
ncbi:MAG TPA: serine--tRNA ligase, partial [Gemmatimonadota bacterium]|nr:serine--tRNA ligase [Gemmatimonadota bacterium]